MSIDQKLIDELSEREREAMEYLVETDEDDGSISEAVLREAADSHVVALREAIGKVLATVGIEIEPYEPPERGDYEDGGLVAPGRWTRRREKVRMRYGQPPYLYAVGQIDDFEPMMVFDREISASETLGHLESFIAHELEARRRFDRCIERGASQRFSTAAVPGISIYHGCPMTGTGDLIWRSELTGDLASIAEAVSALVADTLDRTVLARHDPGTASAFPMAVA